jgi:hypothetical protein
VLVFPPGYINPAEQEPGAYLHWVSFVDPARRTPMIAEGMPAAHTAECRALKAVLERGAGRRCAAYGRYVVRSETIYVDAPVRVGAEYLADIRSMAEYAFLLRPDGDVFPDEGSFLDEYGWRVTMRSRMHVMGEASLVEHEATYPGDDGFVQRSVTLLVPCSYAFGQPQARGFIKHRVTFWPAEARADRPHGAVRHPLCRRRLSSLRAGRGRRVPGHRAARRRAGLPARAGLCRPDPSGGCPRDLRHRTARGRARRRLHLHRHQPHPAVRGGVDRRLRRGGHPQRRGRGPARRSHLRAGAGGRGALHAGHP